MNKLSRGKPTHSDRLERWLGAETVARVSREFGKFYFPVPLNGVPGKVFVMPGGDFAGEIEAGQFMSSRDSAAVTLRKLRNRIDASARGSKAAKTLSEMIRADDRVAYSVGAFSSIDAVVAAVTGGKGQILPFSKTTVAVNAIGQASDLFMRTGNPTAGAAAAVAPGGTVPTSATTGSLRFVNKGAANSGHYLNWTLTGSVAGNSLMLYDRIFAVLKALNVTTAETVTGVPTRYQSTVATDAQYIGGNFCFPTVTGTALAATAHNWTGTYVDETGAAGTFVTTAGVASATVGSVDMSVGNWFMPLGAGDVGIRNFSGLQLTAALATGSLDWVIGHPIAVNVCPISNVACLDDGLYTSMNLTTILDNACLSFIELPKPSTAAVTYSGFVRTVSE